MAYLVKEYDIPAGLIVNIDQTQCIYAMATNRSWAPKGDKQVAVLGKEEKRAITLTVGLSAAGHALPTQAIYQSMTAASLPTPTTRRAMEEAGFRFESSLTKTYWATQETMRAYVDHILVSHYDQVKLELNCPADQRSILYLDVWAVHRSDEFRTWMRENHPTILLIYVPAGCTGDFQPCDTGGQRPMKHAIRRAQLADTIEESMKQLESGVPPERIKASTSLPELRNRTPGWIEKGHRALTSAVASKVCLLIGVLVWPI